MKIAYNTRIAQIEEKEEKLFKAYEDKARDLESRIKNEQKNLRDRAREMGRDLEYGKKTLDYDKNRFSEESERLEKFKRELGLKEKELEGIQNSYE